MARTSRRPSRFRRRLGWSAVLLAALVGGAWYALDQYVKGDAIRQMVTRRITDATGRTAMIRDPLRLTFGLQPAVKVSGFSLANAEWGSAPQMLTAETVLLRVDLARLLSHEIVVTDLELEQPQVLLEVNPQGKGNWQFTPRTTRPAQDAATPPAAATPDQQFRLVMQSVKITDGHIVWHDSGKKTRQTLMLEAVTLRPEGDGGRANLIGNYQDLSYNIDLSVKQLRPLWQHKGAVPFDLNAQLADSTLHATGEVTLGTSAPGGLPIRQFQTEVRGNLPTLAVLKPFMATEASLPDVGPVQLRLALSGTPEKLRLSPLQVQALDSELAGTLTVTPPRKGGDLALAGAVQLQTASLAKLGAALQQNLSPTPLTLATEVALANRTLRLTALDLRAGESALTGTARVVLPEKDQKFPADMTVNLVASRLRPGDFLAGYSETPAKATTKSQEADRPKDPDAPIFSRDPLPLAGLQGVRGDVKVAIARLDLPAREQNPVRTFRDVRLTLAADGRSVRMTELHADLPGSGQLRGTARLDVAAEPARLQYQVAGTEVVLGTFLREWGVTEDVQDGATRLVSRGETAGASLHDWAANLSGETAVVVQNARVEGGITEVLGGPLVQGLLPGLAEGGTGAVTVNCVVSRWPTQGGVMRTDLTLIDTSQLTVAGTGDVRLGDETVQVTLIPRAKRESLSGLTTPVSIRGQLNSPSFRLDQKAVAGDLLQGVLSGQITTGKPLEVLGQIFGPRGGNGGAGAPTDPCAQVLTATGEIRRSGDPAPAVAAPPSDTDQSQQPTQPRQGILPQKLEERLDKILPGVGGLLGR